MIYKYTRAQILAETPTMLNRQLFVVFTTPIPGNEHLLDKVTPAHLDHQLLLERQDIMLAAGPFWTEDGQHHLGEGMFILRADSVQQVRAICDADPMHASSARSYRIRPWMMNEGGITIWVSFSDQRAQIL